ncbi:MAG: hypothetical protein DRI75_06830 [Bacteroidetes bacterium]|nr:MAG: hypothetical protein DRI75_06830 [Bacteroidota bacterium]
MNRIYLILILFIFSCNTGNLTVIANLPTSLKEVSAIEISSSSNLFWVIEDAGNDNKLYGLDLNGKIDKALEVINAQNIDWEDLTTDDSGNIYIGDFGNNNKNRSKFTIYKVEHPELALKTIKAESITFSLPKNIKNQDFEAFFLLNDIFYIFSKDDKLFRVPNSIGTHQAVFITNFNLNGKHNAITSADVNNNSIILLNHDKIWKISNYKDDNFFNGDIVELMFNHSSQKEGVCFKNNKTLYLTDEKVHVEGGNLYEFELD